MSETAPARESIRMLRVRVARARDLLRRGTAVCEVSALCGFAHQSHLGRHFKRHTGLKPAQHLSKLQLEG